MVKSRKSRRPPKPRVLRQLERIADASRGPERHKLLRKLVEAELQDQDPWEAILREWPYKEKATPGHSNLKRQFLLVIDDLKNFYIDAPPDDDVLISFSTDRRMRKWHYRPKIEWRDGPAKDAKARQQRKPELVGSSSALPPRKAIGRYLKSLIDKIERSAGYYTAAEGTQRPYQDLHDVIAQHEHAYPGDDARQKPRSFDDVLEAFEEVPQAVVLSAPGGGKTTALQRRAWQLAKQTLEQDNESGLVPLLVSLDGWADDKISLEQYLITEYSEIGKAVAALSEAGRLVLLLDGLNERPTDLVDRAKKIRDFRKKVLGEQTPLYVSCRHNDYKGRVDLGLDKLTIEPLTPPRVLKALVRRAKADGKPAGSGEELFWDLSGDPRLKAVLEAWTAAGGDEDAFWTKESEREVHKRLDLYQHARWRQHVLDERSLVRLAANPFTLEMIYKVWSGGRLRSRTGKLPHNKAALFRLFVSWLLEKEGLAEEDDGPDEWSPTIDGENLLDGLKALAWVIHSNHVEAARSRKGSVGVLTVMPRKDALKLPKFDRSVLRLALGTSLIEGGSELRFRHQLLQEYFAALDLKERLDNADETNAPRASELYPAERWWERSGWEEVCVLLAGIYRNGEPVAIDWLKDAQPEVAAQCLLESGADIADWNGLMSELRDAWMPRLTDVDGEPRPEARAAVGRALGRLRFERFNNGGPLDDRKGVALDQDRLPDIDWVEVPGGEFIYQDGTETVETFSIGRYPITNIQFEAFLDAEDGYDNDQWWDEIDDVEAPEWTLIFGPPRGPRKPTWSESNSPRGSVNWYEATAFCRWLGGKLKEKIRLPTEQEWEKAASWDPVTETKREYPWVGDFASNRCNTQESGIGRTTAVGAYPVNKDGSNCDSPYGCHDMAGNVWEWTASVENKGRARVLRGGSWLNGPHCVRAVLRLDYLPYNRDTHFGFRVVRASSITEH